MPSRPQVFRPGTFKGKQQRDRDHDAKRRAENAERGWYKRAIWCHPVTGLRAQQLAQQPLCERCLARGIVTAATVANHRKPHKGDWSLFADPKNLESACDPCHNRDIQREERRAAGQSWS
jgi:5-methylcytosine-specific restriction endonuclease McrA